MHQETRYLSSGREKLCAFFRLIHSSDLGFIIRYNILSLDLVLNLTLFFSFVITHNCSQYHPQMLICCHFTLYSASHTSYGCPCTWILIHWLLIHIYLSIYPNDPPPESVHFLRPHPWLLVPRHFILVFHTLASSFLRLTSASNPLKIFL